MKAYITLLSNKNYLEGVLILNESLKKVNSAYPLYCMLSPNVDNSIQNRLENANVYCIRINKSVIENQESVNNDFFSYWNYTFDKLMIWGLTQFEKLVYLDSDMVILKNIDLLFDKESFSAVCAGKSFPGNDRWIELNSGVIVLTPDSEIEKKLIALAPKIIEEYKKKNKPLGDQDIINNFLSNWFNEKHLILDEGFNIFASYLSYYIKEKGYSLNSKRKKPIYIVHFTGNYKPWTIKTINDYLRILKRIYINPYLGIVLYNYWKLLRLVRK